MIKSPERLELLILLAAGIYAVASPTGQGPVSGGSPSGAAQPAEQNPASDELGLAVREALGDGHSIRIGSSEFIYEGVVDYSGIADDLFVWAWLPTISGTIEDNAFIGAQKVDLGAQGKVGGDLFLFAQSAHIDGAVEGDVYSFVGGLTVGAGGSVAGGIIGSSESLSINGSVGGPINFAGGTVVLNGPVHGDVRLKAGNLALGPNAHIEGDLRYESARDAQVDPAAVVDGEMRHLLPRSDEGEGGGAGAQTAAAGWFSFWGLVKSGWWYVATFLVGALALAVGGDAARRPAACLAGQPALGLGFGFVVAVVLPAAAIAAIILLVTLPLGIIGLAVYAIAAYMARLVTAQTIGARLLSLAGRGGEPSAYASLAVGLVLFYFLTKIPYVGFLIWLAAIVAGLGGIFLALRKPAQPHVGAPVAEPTA